jgi:hypothetical protein
MNFMADEEEDEMLNAIVHWQVIARGTNWCWLSTALSQRDVAVAASLHSSISFILLFFI